MEFLSEDLGHEMLSRISNNIDSDSCNQAMKSLNIMIEKSESWQEPIFLSYLPTLMDNISFFKTSEQAEITATAIIEKMNIYSINVVLDLLFQSMESLKWQTKCGALTILSMFKKLDAKSCATKFTKNNFKIN